MILALLLALGMLAGTQAQPLTIVDGNDVPVAAAVVVFIDAGGERDVEHADALGRVAARNGFAPVRAEVSAPGYVPLTVALSSNVLSTIRMTPTVRTIVNVRVATGAPQNLHQLPVAAAALDRATIAGNPAATSDELLRALPGFDRNRSNSAFTNYGQLRVSFAGAGNDRGVVLVDGLPAQDGFGGQIDWAAYPPEILTGAEILLGAGSALYGSGAVGGVLELHTFAPASGSAPVQGVITAAAGSHAFSSMTAQVRVPISSKTSLAVAAHNQNMQYFDLPPPYQSALVTAAHSASSMGSVKVRYDAARTAIFEFGALGAWDDQQEGRPNYRFSRRLAQADFAYLRPSAKALVSFRYFVRTAHVENIADQFPRNPGALLYTQNVPTAESGSLFSWTLQNDRSAFEVRADGRWVHGASEQHGPTGSFQSGAGGTQRLGGIAIAETLRGPRAELAAGARVDVVTFVHTPARRSSAVSPRIAARYDLSRNVSVRMSAGGGFRAPYLNELLRGFVIGNVSYEPNPDLVPERSRTNSAGFDWIGGDNRVSIDLFDTSVSNAIAFRTIDPRHQMRSNIERTRTDGAILTYARDITPCSRLSFSATEQNARVTGGTSAIIGKRLAYVPQTSATLAFDGKVGSVLGGITASYLGQTYADDLNAQPLGTAILIGARLRLPMSRGSAITLSAQNLTDARYLSSIDRYGPPAVVSLGISLPVGAPNTAAGTPSCFNGGR